MIDDGLLKAWFIKEIFVLEGPLTRFIARNWRDTHDVADLRQEIYELTLKAAREELPRSGRAMLFTIARNLIINKARRLQIVSFEHIADLEMLDVGADPASTDRHIDARDALRRAYIGLEALPPRCREVVRLRKVEGLTTRETANRLSISVHTVERQLVIGMRAMTEHMLCDDGIDRGNAAPVGQILRS